MSLRDYFAALAIQGYCSHSGGMMTIENAAVRAYTVADAMLKARGE
jgi:hypothetical protein